MRLFFLVSFFLTACDRDAQYEIKSLASSVSETWAECDPSTVSKVADELSVRFIEAFEPCHSNNFTRGIWSPDGIHLYFQLAFSAHVLNGETKALYAMPAESGLPQGDALWLDNQTFAVAMENTESELKISQFQLPKEAGSPLVLSQESALELKEPLSLQASAEPDIIYLTALNSDDQRTVFRLDLNTGKSSEAFGWAESGIESFSYYPKEDLVFLGRNNSVEAHRGSTGESVYRFPNAKRGIMHPLGTMIALESTGDPISTYTPRYKGELTNAMKRREEARRAEWEEEKPDWIPESITPPAIDFWDVELKRRVRFFQIHGDTFQWYPGNPYYLSFRLWGLGDQQLNPNILLSDIPARLKVIALDEELDPGMMVVSDKIENP